MMSGPRRAQRNVAASRSLDDASFRAQRRDRALRRGAVATGLVRLATALTSFGTYAIAARVLTSDEFGLVAVVISLWLILTMFDMGLGGALATRVAVSHARDDVAEIRVHVNHALVTLAGIGGLIAVVGSVSAVVLPWQDWISGDIRPDTLTAEPDHHVRRGWRGDAGSSGSHLHVRDATVRHGADQRGGRWLVDLDRERRRGCDKTPG